MICSYQPFIERPIWIGPIHTLPIGLTGKFISASEPRGNLKELPGHRVIVRPMDRNSWPNPMYLFEIHSLDTKKMWCVQKNRDEHIIVRIERS